MDVQLKDAMLQALDRLKTQLATMTKANSLKLEGRDLDQLTTEVLAGTVANTLLITGKSLDDLQVDFGEDNAALVALQAAIEAFAEREDNPHQVTAEQIVLDLLMNQGFATQEEFTAGVDNKYVNPAVIKAAIDAAIQQLVGDSPETMDTLQEIAAILQDDPQVINNLMNQVGGLLSSAEVQVIMDKVVSDHKDYADTLYASKLTQAEEHSDANIWALVNALGLAADVIDPILSTSPDRPLFGTHLTSGENSEFRVTDTANSSFNDYGWLMFDSHSQPAVPVRSFWYAQGNHATAYAQVECLKAPRVLRHMRLLHDMRAWQVQNNQSQAATDSYRPGFIEVSARNTLTDAWVVLRPLTKALYWETNPDTTLRADVVFQNETAYKYYRFRLGILSGSSGCTLNNLQLSEERPQGAPGSVLLVGDKNLGYYGEIAATDVVIPATLASTIGLTSGTLMNAAAPWLKFAYLGKTLLVARQPHRHTVTRTILNARGLFAANGAGPYTFNGKSYRVRLLDGIEGSPTVLGEGGHATDPVYGRNTEFGNLLYRVASTGGHTGEDKWANYTDAQLGVVTGYTAGSGTICQESTSDSLTMFRGHRGLKSVHRGSMSGAPSARGFRPVLEEV